MISNRILQLKRAPQQSYVNHESIFSCRTGRNVLKLLHRVNSARGIKCKECARNIPNWRPRTQPIRTAAEITARIKIEPVHPLYLYQKLSQKATKLRLLGMTYPQIAKALNVSTTTVKHAVPPSLRGGLPSSLREDRPPSLRGAKRRSNPKKRKEP